VLPGVDQPTPNEPETTQVELQTPGEHNVRNAAAALAVAHLLELPLAPAAAALSEFRGTGRRFEVRGEAGGVIAIDDYAHHPTEIRATLAAARERYPARRIWAVWQPHTYSRLQALFNEFASAFSDADQVLVTEIYAAREAPPSLAFSASQVADAIRQHAAKREGKPKSVHFAASLPAAGELLRTQVRPGDVVLVLSAGDADVLSKELLAGLQAAENQSHASNPPALKIRRGVRLDHYTAARIGGPADLLIEVESEAELAQAARYCWSRGLPFFILGGGSNMLVSETGWRGAVILNHAGGVEFNEQADPPTVWAESGANFGLLARLAAQRGLAGLEWAAGIPGTLGGALVGNAGAHGGDLAGNFRVAKILHLDTHTGQPVQVQWNAEQMQFAYRSSRLKSQPGAAVVLSARLHLQRSTPEAVQTRLDEFRAFRRRTQPPGASMGSMFKNPPGDYAGRLIEAAGLKGARRGQAEISPLHANFFINHGGASALEVYSLIELAQETVEKKFGVRLELEIELKGEWRLENSALTNQHS
jgi:UDP-N-acetylmuramate dehydrogenase